MSHRQSTLDIDHLQMNESINYDSEQSQSLKLDTTNPC